MTQPLKKQVDIIEITDPPAGAICRSFTCCLCGKEHLQTGRLVRVFYIKSEVTREGSESCARGMGLL